MMTRGTPMTQETPICIICYKYIPYIKDISSHYLPLKHTIPYGEFPGHHCPTFHTEVSQFGQGSALAIAEPWPVWPLRGPVVAKQGDFEKTWEEHGETANETELFTGNRRYRSKWRFPESSRGIFRFSRSQKPSSELGVPPWRAGNLPMVITGNHGPQLVRHDLPI